MRRIVLQIIIIGVLSLPVMLLADPYGVEFMADAVQSLPQQNITKAAKMYVGRQGNRRIEYAINNTKVVDIFMPGRGLGWRINLADKTYVELPSNPTPSPAEQKANPCAGQVNATCKNLGRETINSREAVKWEMVVSYKNQDVKMLRWVDVDNGFPLIQQMPNGQKAVMKLVDKEQVNGRSVEKWELVSSWNQQNASSFQWYDPILKLAVREEGPNGMVNELRNIRVGPQSEYLFQVPAGFKKTDAPQQGGLQMVPVK